MNENIWYFLCVTKMLTVFKILHTASSGSAPNAVLGNTYLLPSFDECSEPVEELPFHDNKILKVNRNSADGDYGLSLSAPTLRAPQSISGTDKDSYKSPTQLTVQDENVAPSRSGTGTDPYKFNASKFRASIKQGSLIALDNERPNHSDEVNSGEPQRSQFEEDTSNAAVTGENKADIDDDDINPNTNTNRRSVEREVISQALLYICCFFLTYIFAAVSRAIDIQGKEMPYALIVLDRFFLPLQGFFDIMVYTRPHIVPLAQSLCYCVQSWRG